MTTKYTPIDVYNFARDGNVDQLIVALNQGDNCTNMHIDENDSTALLHIWGFLSSSQFQITRPRKVYPW